MKSHSEATKLLSTNEFKSESKVIDSKSYTSYLCKQIKKPWDESIIPFFKCYFHSEIGAGVLHPDNLCPNLLLGLLALPFCLTCGTAYCVCATIPAPCNAYKEMKRDRFFKPSSVPSAPSDQAMDESDKPTFTRSQFEFGQESNRVKTLLRF